MIAHCPTCKKPVELSPQQRWRPFCSERCHMIDLGKWASEEHRIAGETIHIPTEEESDFNER